MKERNVPGKFERGVVNLERLIRALVEKDGCFATNNWFSEQLGVSPRQVARYLKCLRERGVIRWHSKQQHRYGRFITRRQIFLEADLEGPNARPERQGQWIAWTYEPVRTFLQRVEVVADAALDVLPIPCGEVEEEPRPVDVSKLADSADFLKFTPAEGEEESEVERCARENGMTVDEYLSALSDLAKPLPVPPKPPKIVRDRWKPGTYPIPDPAQMEPAERWNIENWGERVPHEILLDFDEEEFALWLNDRARRYDEFRQTEAQAAVERGKAFQKQIETAIKQAARENPFLPGGDFYIISKPDNRPRNENWEKRPRSASDPEIYQYLKRAKEEVMEEMARGRATDDRNSWYERAKRGEIPSSDTFLDKCRDGRLEKEGKEYTQKLFEEAERMMWDPVGVVLDRIERINQAAITGDFDDGEFYDNDPLGAQNK